MSSFFESVRDLEKNSVISLLSWSYIEPLAAFSVTAINGGRETHKINFITNEVSNFID